MQSTSSVIQKAINNKKLSSDNQNAVPYEEINIDVNTKLGQGSFGMVFKADWKGKTVAVKKISIESPLTSTDCHKEIEMMKKVTSFNSPYLVAFYAYTISNNSYFILMEYLSLGALSSYIANHAVDNSFNWSTRYQIAKDVASGLKELHANGLIHHDVKSSNIVLDVNVRAKLCDFAFTEEASIERLAEEKGVERIVCGSMKWMAPEVLFSKMPRSYEKVDMFSLGTVFWELAALKKPFAGLTHFYIKHAYQSNRSYRETIPADCPPKFSQLIDSLWKVNPEERPSAPEVLTELATIQLI